MLLVNPNINSLHTNSFVSSLGEIGRVVLLKNIYEIPKCISTMLVLSPLEKDHGPSFEQTWIPFTQDGLWQVNLKVMRNNDNDDANNDDSQLTAFQSEKPTLTFGLG